ncbi:MULTISPECIES: PIN domain-containing protein [unclassified Agrobacterium]|uniref:PIN domain-containing protein n=1 Tax=unclassified Agrobacterium TaxID=2632611 RepID=UPI00244BD286|nr:MULTISPECIES: PIN domain-containing protein [unclassified Agrobacterium]MDH0613254.1 PIN domain-containing protein [Agrobacterium sp. GD03872]MDH0695119.1 PIN domain-containing protein [Agrobacterium sp. GD03871]MDH1057483.1 PIN domain-containing protein [Agrobacterium sp. GD03992]MDH2208772.1 PIN domain-containing protein [Agrobacterium sp. GD03643]MDH2218263.1 PIN domain-containing protein [Agrobacterium sp. GD03638]
MSHLPFLDTNIFIYAFLDDERSSRAQEIVSKPYVTSVQAFNEFASVVRRKWPQKWVEIRRSLDGLRRMAVTVVELDVQLNASAIDLVDKYNFAFYDALMVAAALEAESAVFLSEDMHDGLTVEGRMKIANPFTARLHA